MTIKEYKNGKLYEIKLNKLANSLGVSPSKKVRRYVVQCRRQKVVNIFMFEILTLCKLYHYFKSVFQPNLFKASNGIDKHRIKLQYVLSLSLLRPF